jgi:hypothetical protein
MTANQGRCLAYQCQVFDIISYTVRTESCVADPNVDIVATHGVQVTKWQPQTTHRIGYRRRV